MINVERAYCRLVGYDKFNKMSDKLDFKMYDDKQLYEYLLTYAFPSISAALVKTADLFQCLPHLQRKAAH